MPKGIYKRIDEHKKNMSKARIRLYEEGKLKKYFGDESPTRRPEIRERISIIRKNNPIRYWLGKKRSLETIRKIKEKRAKQIIVHSEETKRKISEAQKGEKNHLFGKHITLEHKEKISEANKGKKKNPFTQEHKLKLSIARRKQIFPLKDTLIEIKIQDYLKELGIKFFTHQYIKEIEHSYQCDILIPSLNMVIECDGNYWHKYPIGNEIDHIRTIELIEKGFKVLRLWESEIKIMSFQYFSKRLDNCGYKIQNGN